MHVSLRAALAVALAGTGGTAWAQSVELGGQVGNDGANASADANAPSDPDGPPETGAEQFTLPKGTLFIEAFVGLNLSKDLVGKPISLSPDIWYGVTDDLTLGLVHSAIGSTGVIGGVGQSLCVTGDKKGCESIYRNVGIDVRYRLKGAFAVDGGLYVRDFDPFQLAIKVGLLGRHRVIPKLAIEFNPNIFVGVTKRDGEADSMGIVTAGPNKEELSIPVTVGFAVIPKLTLNAQVALQTPFEDAGDLWRLSVAIGARFRVNHHLDLGLAFALPLLVGGADDGTGVDLRTLTLGVAYAL